MHDDRHIPGVDVDPATIRRTELGREPETWRDEGTCKCVSSIFLCSDDLRIDSSFSFSLISPISEFADDSPGELLAEGLIWPGSSTISLVGVGAWTTGASARCPSPSRAQNRKRGPTTHWRSCCRADRYVKRCSANPQPKCNSLLDL